MQERLIIKSFAGIKEAQIDINKINLFIGPQASGKSIIAKLAYFFKNFNSLLLKAIEEEKTKTEFDKIILKKFEYYFPPPTWPEYGFSIRFELGEFFIELVRDITKGKLILSYSHFFYQKLQYYKRDYRERIKEHVSKEDEFDEILIKSMELQQRFYTRLQKDISRYSSFRQIFIPAGRSFFANLQSNIFTFLSNSQLDPILIEFGAFYEQTKAISEQLSTRKSQKTLGTIDRLVGEILVGSYQRDKKGDYLVHTDGRKVNIPYCSSGHQEILPLIIILLRIRASSVGSTVYIEEPEAHLFPQSQKAIVELIMSIMNKESMQLFITTHSPYILSSFNNLIEAGRLGQELPQDQLKALYKIVPKEQFVDYNEINVYSVDNGKVKTALDKDMQLIAQNVLDDVSNDISIQFGKLLDLQ